MNFLRISGFLALLVAIQTSLSAQDESASAPIIDTGGEYKEPIPEEGNPQYIDINPGGDVAPVAVTPETKVIPSQRLEEWDLPVQLADGFKIKKVYDFLNDPEITKVGRERSLEYEFQYFNHGAVTKAQRYNRVGQYYVVTWSCKGDPKEVTLRLDYRQGLTREKVTTLEIPYEDAKGTYKGTFAVTGDQYYLNGQLLSWRISLVHDGVIVAQEKSFVW
ncbi:MAG: hypothetical protein AAFY98_03970 [Verrucomicrobiota bacterium]